MPYYEHVFITRPEIAPQQVEKLAEEVKARGARTILITNKNIIDNKLYDHVIEIPYNKYYGNILANIILQIISYELSVSKGINPDMPRNLAKVVTVD